MALFSFTKTEADMINSLEYDANNCLEGNHILICAIRLF